MGVLVKICLGMLMQHLKLQSLRGPGEGKQRKVFPIVDEEFWPCGQRSSAFCNTGHLVLQGRPSASSATGGADAVETLEELHRMDRAIFERMEDYAAGQEDAGDY